MRNDRGQVEVREEIDGVRWLLPPPLDNPVRRQAGTLLIVLAVVELVITSLVLVAVLAGTGAALPAAAKWILGAAVVGGALAMMATGALLWRSRTEISLGRQWLTSWVGVGLLRWRRRIRIEEIDHLALEREVLKGVNIPGAREGTPDYLRLSARGCPRQEGRAMGRGRTIAGGHHRDLLEPLAQEIAGRLRVEVVDLEQAGPDRAAGWREGA